MIGTNCLCSILTQEHQSSWLASDQWAKKSQHPFHKGNFRSKSVAREIGRRRRARGKDSPKFWSLTVEPLAVLQSFSFYENPYEFPMKDIDRDVRHATSHLDGYCLCAQRYRPWDVERKWRRPQATCDKICFLFHDRTARIFQNCSFR